MILSNNSDNSEQRIFALQNQAPQFRVLSEVQCREIYLATLECLQRIGVQVNNAEARQILAAAGATVEENRVYIPPQIIQDAISAAPHTFIIGGRDEKRAIHIAPNRVHFGPGPTCSNFIDPQTGERRPARRGDAGLTARVVDALENIDYAMGLSLASDVKPVLAPVYEFAEMIANTTKPVIAWAYNRATLSDIYRIAIAVAGSEAELRQRPNFAYFATYKSPLQHSDDEVGNILWAAEHGVPVSYLGGPTVGLESPATGASGLVIYLAAALSGLAIIQLKHRGAPVMIGGLPSPMDLRTARPAYGSPEMSLHVAAAAELARYLDLPFMGTAGASESKQLDAQAAAEASIQILMSALSGASLVHDMGFLDCADIGSLPYLVLTDEIVAMVKRIMRGIPVNHETIMLDLIKKVGPGGQYLTEKRSVSLCRSEIWVPTLMERNSFAAWAKQGSPSLEARVSEKLQKILASHHPSPLPPDVTEKIALILNEAEQRER